MSSQPSSIDLRPVAPIIIAHPLVYGRVGLEHTKAAFKEG